MGVVHSSKLSLYSDGESPVEFLNTLQKYELLSKPHSSAIFVIDMLLDSKTFFDDSIRILVRYCMMVYPVTCLKIVSIYL